MGWMSRRKGPLDCTSEELSLSPGSAVWPGASPFASLVLSFPFCNVKESDWMITKGPSILIL